jgi:hypothetical protein
MNQQCIIDAFGEAEGNAILSIMTKLPNGEVDLLKIIAAAMGQIAGNSEEQAEMTFVGSDNVAIPAGGDTALPNIPADATIAVITAYDNDVVFTLDTTSPDFTTANGHLLPVETTININSGLAELLFNPIDATAANLYVSYYK